MKAVREIIKVRETKSKKYSQRKNDTVIEIDE